MNKKMTKGPLHLRDSLLSRAVGLISLSVKNKTLRVKFIARLTFTLLILSFLVISHAQWVETTIYLPDSLCGIEDLRAFAHNAINNKIYLTGWGYADDSKLFRENLVIVIDANSDEKIAKIPTGGDYPIALLWTPNANKVYVSNYGGANVRVYDGVTNSIITTVEVGGGPCAFTYNATNRKVYVANSFDNNVTVIDEISNQVIRTIPTGAAPSSLLWNATDNKIYAVNYDGHSVTIIDGVTDNVIRTLGVGLYPVAPIWNSTNNKIYVPNSVSNTVAIIDGLSDSIIITVPVGNDPQRLVWNSINNKVYVTNYADSSITIINGQTNDTIRTVCIETAPMAIAWSAMSNKVYVANNRPGSINEITVIDGLTDEIVKIFELGGEISEPQLLWNSFNNKIYASISFAFPTLTQIQVINCYADSIVNTIPVSLYTPSNVLWNLVNNKVYVATDDGYVSIIDGESNSVICDVKTNSTCQEMTINLTNNKIYIESHDSISIISGETNSLIRKMNVAGRLAWNSISNKVYVSNWPWFPHEVTVIDGVTDSIIKKIINIEAASILTFNSTNNKIYLINGLSNNTITVINGTTDTIIGVIQVDSSPQDIIWEESLNKVYVSNGIGRSITVIDGATNLIVTTIRGVGNYLGSLVFNSTNYKLYVLKSGGVTVINAITNVISNNITIDGILTGLLWNSLNNKLYVLNASDSTVVIIDGSTDSILTRLPTGNNPVAIAWNSAYNRMYIANSYGKTITVVRDIFPGISENNKTINQNADFCLNVSLNPFRHKIIITFSRSDNKEVSLSIYNTVGELIKNFSSSQGNTISWDGRDNNGKEVMPGIYFCALKQGQKLITQKIQGVW